MQANLNNPNAVGVPLPEALPQAQPGQAQAPAPAPAMEQAAAQVAQALVEQGEPGTPPEQMIPAFGQGLAQWLNQHPPGAHAPAAVNLMAQFDAAASPPGSSPPNIPSANSAQTTFPYQPSPDTPTSR